MATAAPHVKLLRQLASAKDDYLSGAFDISWDGAKATLFLVFGRPSHAVFETDQAQIEGEAAIDALLAALPRVFYVSDWRRAMSPHETLSITIDELAGPFVRLAGSYADDPVVEEDPEWWSAVDDAPDLPFGLSDFPLLPGGRPLWVEASPDEVHLSERLSELPPSILILTGAKLRAAAVVSGGDLIDAVWLDSDDHARGETAGMALLGATKGSLAGYALDDPRVAEALTMLWRLPVAVSGVELAWLDPASMLAAFRADGLDRVLVIDAPVRGIALFSRGGLVAVYSETQRSAVASPERLRSLLSQARGRLTVMERKPRPVAADATTAPVSANAFFEVATVPATADDFEETVAPAVDTSDEAAAAVVDEDTSGVIAESATTDEAPHSEDAAPATTASVETDEAAPDASLVAAPRDAADHEDITEAATDEHDEPVASWGYAAASSETDTVAADSTSNSEQPAAAASADTFAPPPPPPDELVADAGDATPPPPAPASTQPTQKSKRSRWGFGRSRKSKAEKQAVDDALAGVSGLAGDAEPPKFDGWSVRQPSETPQPIWLRSHTVADEPPPPPEAEDVGETTETPTWSVASRQDDTEAPADASTVDAPQAAAEVSVADAPPDATGEVSTVDADAAVAGEDAEAASPAPVETTLQPDFTHHGSDAHDHAVAPPAEEQAHPFDFVSLDEPATEPDPAPQAAPASWASSSWLDDVVHGAPEADEASEPSAESGTPALESVHADWNNEATAEQDHVEPDHDAVPEPEHAGWGFAATAHGSTSPSDVTDEASTDIESLADALAEADAAAGEDETDHDPAVPRAAPVLRTPGPWSWPLAEPDEEIHQSRDTGSASPLSWGEPDEAELEPAAVPASAYEDAASASADGADPGFFHRDEPVGSQYVDFDEVRNELVQIGIVWLGESNAVQVTALLSSTRSTIDDFVATIDTIRGLHVDGQDPASIQAMAREMHQQAAERLCGA